MRSRWLGPVVVVLMVVFLAVVWHSLPERMVVHWGLSFQPDGWGSRLWGAGSFPLIALGCWLLLPLLRRIDPRRRNYDRFDPTFWIVVNLVVLLVAFMEVAVVGYNLGWPIDMGRTVLLLLGLLFVTLGNYMPRVRSNFWMGIRTPWTLSSDYVWRETHRVGGRVFVAGGLITIAAAFLPPALAPWVALGGLLVGGFVPVVYSYVIWRRQPPESDRP